MRKRHGYEARLKYMQLLEEGYSINHIHRTYGISYELLSDLWQRYRKEGASALEKKATTRVGVQEKIDIIRECEEKGLSLSEIRVRYNESAHALFSWRKRYREGGESLLAQDGRGRKPGTTGRPKKREPQTELERLQEEVKVLRAENALLKKVKALVEAREARLRGMGRRPSTNQGGRMNRSFY